MNDEKNIAGRKTPYRARKRVLVPRRIIEVGQPVAPLSARLNSNFFITPLHPKGGAPLGNSNALRHGRHTREMRAFRAEVRALVRENWRLIGAVKRLLREAAGDIRADSDDPRSS